VTPLRVVELAQGFAGPVCGRLFAALGHEVVKCEPPGGDYLRANGEHGDDARLMAHGFAAVNAGKQSVVADLGSPEGLALARSLVDTADVIVSDLPPADAERLGVLGDARARTWPDLVTVSLTSFGLDAELPFARPDSLLAEAFGGLAVMIGEPDECPLALGGEQAAHAAGIVGFLGATLALERVRRGLGGDVVDVALSDVAAYIDWKSDIGYAATGVVPHRSGVKAGRWRMVRAADGWVGVIYQPEQWAAMVELVGDPRLDDPALAEEAVRDARAAQCWPVVEEWVGARGRREVFEQAQRLGLAFGMNLDVGELAESAQYRARGFLRPVPGEAPQVGALFRAEGLGWREGAPPALGDHAPGGPWRAPVPTDRQGDAPLAGMVVLDLGTITAGAATGRLLADYGATVIKVEAPERPDSFRRWGVPDGDPGGVSPVFESNNAGKLGIALDLKSADGRAAFLHLVTTADVVLENFQVGVTRRLGIDDAALREVNPDLVYLSLSSQGQDGPEAAYRSYGSTLDLLSGLASVTGYDGSVPIWSSVDVNYPDQLVSLLGAALVAYCWSRGVATHVDVSQRECVSWTLADRIRDHGTGGGIATAIGNRRPGAAPHDVFPCAGEDAWVAVACFTDAQRAALAALVGLVGDPGPDGLDGAVAAWTSARPREQCVRELAAAGVPCAPVLAADERARHPHFARRRVFLEDPDRRKGFPFVMQRYRPPAPGRAPLLGEHIATVVGADPRGATTRAS
jgi:crotonobetainyl-CoA:carnitine CoA-transferase CaiB-like acyl-CoA transferase